MKFDLIHRTNEYASHQPVLIEILRRTSGPVLELGSGEGSTRLLHHLCDGNRYLLTVDDNLEWLERYEELSNISHGFLREDLDKITKRDLITRVEWEVVFLDQGDWNSRTECLMYFKDRARFIILHDSLYYPSNGIFGKLIKPLGKEEEAEATYDDVFKFYKEYYPIKPWNSEFGIMTLVGSNFDPVPESIDMSIESIEV